jgi:hypothetical protein
VTMQRKGNKVDDEPSILNYVETQKIKKSTDVLIIPTLNTKNPNNNLRNISLILIITAIGSWFYLKSLIVR